MAPVQGDDQASLAHAALRWHAGAGAAATTSERLAQEAPVALVYNGVSHAVMMATPLQLDEFALGFSLTEQIVADPDEIYAIEASAAAHGHRIEITLSSRRFAALQERRRTLAGRTGCGLCGVESLDHAVIAPPPLADTLRLDSRALQRALAQLPQLQQLQAETGASHAAAWADRDGEILLVREDVGRHNALDKLVGALARQQRERSGFVVISSRASYEMAAKTAVAGIELLAAISAPTSLAVAWAERAGLTLVGFARPGRHTVYCHPHRLASCAPAHTRLRL